MSDLRAEEVGVLVEELADLLIGSRLEKVYDRPPHGFLLRFRRAGAEGAGATRLPLFITTRPDTSRLHLVEEPGTSPPSPSEPAVELRALLGGTRVVAFDQPGGDRVVRLRCIRGRAEAPRESCEVVLELFGRRGRLLVVETESRRVRFVHGRGGIAVKERYRFPEAPPRRTGETWTMPFEPRDHIPDELRAHPTPFHRFLELRMEALDLRLAVEERLRSATTRLRRERKRRLGLIEKLDREHEVAARHEEWQRRGELLKAEQHRMKRGEASIEVTDWFAPGTPRVRIDLDPRLAPSENLERIFRRARRGKKALPELERRRESQRGELAELEALLSSLSARTAEDLLASPEPLVAAEEWLGSRERSRPPQRQRADRGASAGRGGTPSAPRFRRYRTREGLEVLAGRSAKDNDTLSIRVARGNDLFFHRAGRPGPHVIVRVPKGRQASPESIDDAAFIAAYLAGWRGPGDERVVWTEAKHVRKPKGLSPGQVLTHRTREHRVRFDPARIGALAAPERSDPPAAGLGPVGRGRGQ